MKGLVFCLIIGLVAIVASSGYARPAPAATLGQPYNIVLVYTDDQRWDTLCSEAAGLADICDLPAEERPLSYLEEYLDSSVLFTNAFVTNPTCCPSRSGFLSGGFFSHHTNVLTNDWPNGGARRFSDVVTLATWLQQYGYKTALVGKYLNGYQELFGHDPLEAYVPPGWSTFAASYTLEDWNNDFNFVLGSSTYKQPGTGEVLRIDTGIYLTDYMKSKALRFIDETCPAETCQAPFFLFLSTNAPHEPATPAPRHEGLYSDFVFGDRGWAEGPDGDTSDKPLYVQNQTAVWNPAANEELHRNQLRSLRAIDEALQEIVDKLGQKGLLSNTVIIFASDNGHLWGEHKLEGKFLPYEESIRVPLVISVPGVLPRTEERMVAIDLDLAPTILELAGVPPLGSEGESLMPLLYEQDVVWRTDLLIEGFAGHLPAWHGVRTADGWKYVEYATGETELYDLLNDPYELTSRHADPEYTEMFTHLAARLQLLQPGLTFLSSTLPDPQDDALPAGRIGESYSFQLAATGGNGEYVWSLFTDTEGCIGALPPGLSLDAAGLVSGAPEQEGVWEFCVQVTDTSQSPQPGNLRPETYVKGLRLRVVGYTRYGG
ncbi:MAG: sulfatase-like hydrolase/transferase [Chloroflexota bacterium]